jgi:hypothetical protein
MSRDVSKVKIKHKLKGAQFSTDLSESTNAPVHRIARQRSKNMLGLANSLDVLASAIDLPPQPLIEDRVIESKDPYFLPQIHRITTTDRY